MNTSNIELIMLPAIVYLRPFLNTLLEPVKAISLLVILSGVLLRLGYSDEAMV
jgi:hypothetical protein